MSSSPLRPFDLLSTLLEKRVDFVVIGGFSLAAHGYVRATKDIDIVPSPDPENLRLLWAALVKLDAEPIELGDLEPEEMPVPFDEDGLLAGGNWALRTTHGRLDVMQTVAGMKSYTDLRERAVAVNVPEGGGSIWFAGVDDLIAMKHAANRPEDLADIARLEASREARRAREDEAESDRHGG